MCVLICIWVASRIRQRDCTEFMLITCFPSVRKKICLQPVDGHSFAPVPLRLLPPLCYSTYAISEIFLSVKLCWYFRYRFNLMLFTLSYWHVVLQVCIRGNICVCLCLYLSICVSSAYRCVYRVIWLSVRRQTNTMYSPPYRQTGVRYPEHDKWHNADENS